MQRLNKISLLLATLALSACVNVLGPDYETPSTDWDDGWESTALHSIHQSERDVAAEAQWWRVFSDPVLDGLIDSALAGNYDLKIAGLRVIESRASLRGAKANLAPQSVQLVASGGLGANAKELDSLSDTDFKFSNAELSIGWELDFWGRFRRAIEASNASYLESIAGFEDFKILLTTEIARQYFNYRTLQLRLSRLLLSTRPNSA